jgi:hypothetical protein
VPSEVRRNHVIAVSKRGTEIFKHVRRLATAVQGDNQWGGRWTPLQVMNLAAVSDQEPAAPVPWHVMRIGADVLEPDGRVSLGHALILAH